MKQIEDVIQQYISKKITLKETIDKTIEKIFRNMPYFGIQEMDEDDKSDFITSVYTRLEQVIKSYEPDKSSFRTYLRGFVHSYYLSWTKQKFKKQANISAIEDYVTEEYEFFAADVEEEYTAEVDKKATHQESLEVKKKLQTSLKKIPDSTKLMILALKSANFIQPAHIHKLHLLTGIDEQKIFNMFLQLQGSLYKKKRMYAQQKELQNQSYILKKRSLLLLEKANKDSFLYRSLKKAVKFHDKRWRLNTEKLKNSKLLTPSSSEIARILGLQNSVVRRIQQLAQNHALGIKQTE